MNGDQEPHVGATFAKKISPEEFDRQAEEYTAHMVNRLNESVRQRPELGARSQFFQASNELIWCPPSGKFKSFIFTPETWEH